MRKDPIPSDRDLLIHRLLGTLAPSKTVVQERSAVTDLETVLLNWLPVGTVKEDTVVSPRASAVSADRCFSCGIWTHTTENCRTLDESFPFLPIGWRAERVGDQFILGPGSPAGPEDHEMGNDDWSGRGVGRPDQQCLQTQPPMIRKDSPEPVVPYYVGTSRLEEPADTRKRSWERVDSRPYPDSEESEDDVVYDEECENELQQINLRNEVTNLITVDTCGERCAQLDDFNWFLPTDKWNEKSDTPESEIDTSYSGNGVHVNASDSSSPEMETTTQRLSSPPVVAQMRPKGGCQTAMPRRKRRRRNVRTADNTSAIDTRQESVAPSTFDSERIHKMSECITKGEPKLEAAPLASHGMA